MLEDCMRIKYTVTTSSCPHCGKLLKMENTLWYILLSILFLPIAIIYFVYIFVKGNLESELTYVPSVGNPFKKCPQCGAIVKINDKTPYEELLPEKKHIYDNRDSFNTCYISKTALIVFGVTSLLIFSSGSLDFVVGCISIVVAIISFLVLHSSKKRCKEIINEAKQKKLSTDKDINIKTDKNITKTLNNDPISTPKNYEEQSVNFCRKCGAKLFENSNFCSKCGTKIYQDK